jgi:hypothetical protein
MGEVISGNFVRDVCRSVLPASRSVVFSHSSNLTREPVIFWKQALRAYADVSALEQTMGGKGKLASNTYSLRTGLDRES